RGDRQHLADRLDPVDVAVFVDERRHGLNRRSSSAWAKYALALRRISFACRNSRFSRSSALIRSVSLVVGPGRLPWSRSACRTQRRSVSAVQPNLALIELIAAHCEPCSCWCSSTSRTARSCTSGENFADFLMAPSSQGKEPPEKPGRFTTSETLWSKPSPFPYVALRPRPCCRRSSGSRHPGDEQCP